jgi:FkbM family methyltransferase
VVVFRKKLQKIGGKFVRLVRKQNLPCLKPFAEFLLQIDQQNRRKVFCKKWLKKNPDGYHFDFNGAKLPDFSEDRNKMNELMFIFDDTFMASCFFNDNYEKSIAEYIDQHTNEGPYGYIDGSFDVTVKAGDIVIDAGAWIGDFSAYAVSKGAVAYAFEPVEKNFSMLNKTAELNGGNIYPVQKGLGKDECQVQLYLSSTSLGSSITNETTGNIGEMIAITTLDKFVEKNHIKRIDFIKADIEGAERDMLKGAAHVLKHFAPKLALCTYHFPDDPQIMEKLIMDANPNYTVKHLSHKLYAAVIKA